MFSVNIRNKPYEYSEELGKYAYVGIFVIFSLTSSIIKIMVKAKQCTSH